MMHEIKVVFVLPVIALIFHVIFEIGDIIVKWRYVRNEASYVVANIPFLNMLVSLWKYETNLVCNHF